MPAIEDLRTRILHWDFFDAEMNVSKNVEERLLQEDIDPDPDSTAKSARRRLATMIELFHDRYVKEKVHLEDHAKQDRKLGAEEMGLGMRIIIKISMLTLERK